MKWLNGRKAFLGCIAYGILGIVHGQGWIDQSTYDTGLAIVVAWTGIAFRHALGKKAP